ncbi:SDR family NAD(P)-dependent oxidoreductase (plasmid) [Rhodococcus erythropolis]|uniref:SDR family NAD(P)-dependent oxidoreductase n=1 Tax=Rhodococcus erythropolis TaxID=1833 RepID=UPI00406BA22F
MTGASSGIGAATALALATAGAEVILVARTPGPLTEMVELIRFRGGRAHALPADLTSHSDVEDFADQVLGEIGVPDIIVNNAGAGRFLFLDETDPEEAVQMMAAPYFAAFFVCRAFVTAMVARGSGNLLQINTPVATVPWPGAVGYASARYALRGLTESLRQDLRGTGVRVSSVTPAKVDTPYFESNPGAAERIPRIEKLLGTMTPEQVADVVVSAIRRDADDVHAPWRWAALHPIARAIPRPFHWLAWRTGTKHPSTVVGAV